MNKNFSCNQFKSDGKMPTMAHNRPSDVSSKEHNVSLWNANVSPITQVNEDETIDEEEISPHEGSALYRSF
jgi:hypothetical protein